MKELKQSYRNNLIEIDGSKESLVEDVASVIHYKIHPLSPKRSSRILIVGRSGSGRTTIMNRLCEKLGFIPLSTSELLVDQVRNKTEVGQKIFQDISAHRLISDEIVTGILKGRVNKIDCKTHGYVLEGFPKTEAQISLMHQMKLDPDFVIYIDCSPDLAERRLVSREEQMGKQVDEEGLVNIKIR